MAGLVQGVARFDPGFGTTPGTGDATERKHIVFYAGWFQDVPGDFGELYSESSSYCFGPAHRIAFCQVSH